MRFFSAVDKCEQWRNIRFEVVNLNAFNLVRRPVLDRIHEVFGNRAEKPTTISRPVTMKWISANVVSFEKRDQMHFRYILLQITSILMSLFRKEIPRLKLHTTSHINNNTSGLGIILKSENSNRR